MRVLYIDVYFLINFSVDLLALYFALRLMHVASSGTRAVLAAAIGALFATGVLFLPPSLAWLTVPLALLCLLLMVLVAARCASAKRRLRLGLLFVLFEMLLAGCVYYGYQLLDRYLLPLIAEGEGASENRSLLLFALLVLLSLGVLRLFKLLIGEARGERVCRLTVAWEGRSVETEALVDSGNLLKDPFDGRAVILMKQGCLDALGISTEVLSSLSTGQGGRMRERVRLVPCHIGGEHRLLYGFRPSEIWIGEKHRREQISAVIALDKEEGTYGGYGALVPSAALEHGNS